MHYLLIARFTMDDIPLRLYDAYSGPTAEADAKAIHADPTLLNTKWKRSLDKWPGLPGGFVGAIVLSISDLDGYPAKVRFDSTTEPVPAPPEPAPPEPAPPTTTPPDPAHPPVPEGHIEITDPSHRLRSDIDYALDLADPNDGWSKVEKATVGDNSHKFRFCCPAEHHPLHQSAPASPDPSATDERAILREASEILVKQQIEWKNDIEILRRSNAELLAENNTLVATRTQLHKTISEMLEERSQWIETHAPELQGRYDQCKERVFELESQVGFLNDRNAALVSKNEELQQQKAALTVRVDTNESAIEGLISQNAHLRRLNEDLRRRVAQLEAENSGMAAKNAELQQNNVAYSKKNGELRALNEDLNHRLNATKARAERATDLEGNLRGTAQHLLAHFQRLEDRAKWAFRFADEEMMPLPYARAMLHCQRKFAEEFQGFLHTYPHVLPDIPQEYRPTDDTDDEMND